MRYSNMFPSVSQSLVSRDPSTTTPTFDTELLPTHLQLFLGLGYLPAPGTMASTSIFLATLAWTWATPTLAQKPSGHVLANFKRCISVVMPYQTDLARST